jgi:protein involved in polysaccharide export with SLBB domain
MKDATLVCRSAFAVVCLCPILIFGACAASGPPQQKAETSQMAQTVAASDPAPSASLAPATFAAPTDDNSQALQNLWNSRVDSSNSDSSSDFTLGPGDVLRISLPQVDRAGDPVVRVSHEDTISLPLLGVMSVAGMTEEDFRNDLSRRLAKYFYHPQVAVYLQHTENRQVAVIGAVKTPGRYMLAGRSDTLMTMISRAGGTTEEAASRIILIPANRRVGTEAKRSEAANQDGDLADTAGEAASGISRVSHRETDESTSLSKAVMAQGLIINTTQPANQRYLALPAKSGDVIIVPAAGQVTVQGWVDKPGAFKITAGMTALGSIAAAGGAMFSSSATLLRTQDNGTKLNIPLDLSRIKSGSQPDVPVQGGDVVIVERSVAGAVPYSVYFVVSHMGIGMGIPF